MFRAKYTGMMKEDAAFRVGILKEFRGCRCSNMKEQAESAGEPLMAWVVAISELYGKGAVVVKEGVPYFCCTMCRTR